MTAPDFDEADLYAHDVIALSDTGSKKNNLARAYLELREQTRWRPIEEAPKAGRWVLLWWPEVTAVPFAGYCVNGTWRGAPGNDKWTGIAGPTHFMPLPVPPKEKP